MINNYTYQLKSSTWFSSTYLILFENDEVLCMNCPEYFIKRLTELLNIAWNLGYNSGKIVGRLEDMSGKD